LASVTLTGETARKRVAATRPELTPQEAQIAQLAREGLSNPEIGTRLFPGPVYVDGHGHCSEWYGVIGNASGGDSGHCS
jgi:hypothetical protein